MLHQSARFGIYVASRARIKDRAGMWRALRAAGWPILSSRIDHRGSGPPDYGAVWSRALAEVQQAERLILYVEPGDCPLVGVYVEVGAALGAGVPVLVVAPDVPDSALGSWLAHPLVTRCESLEVAATCAIPVCERDAGSPHGNCPTAADAEPHSSG